MRRLKNAIVAMDIYRSRDDIRLDERQLAQDFGISRTPVREAMAQLEREGFVRSVPRRGIYVVRKTKSEVIEMITAWAALESMAARLITQNATTEEIAALRKMFATFEGDEVRAQLDEYSEVNIEFHQTIIKLSGNRVLIELAENLFTHMRMIRRKTIVEKDRVDRSIRDHMNIIEALEARDDRARRGAGARPCARPGRARRAIRRLSGLNEALRVRRGERDVRSGNEAQQPKPKRNLTDGFNLIIDALKLNGLNTIYGVPGIPITDFGRMAQAAGIRVLSFRHEQNAGYAASIAGFLTKKPGVCLTVSAPGFLNGLTALAHATTNCFPMILISGSSEREIVDLQQGDYEEMDQLAIAKPLCKAAFRVLHAADIGIGVARAIRAAVSGRPGGVYLDLPAKLFGQVMDAEAGKKSLVKVIDAAPAQIPSPDSIKRALDVLKSAKKPLIILGKGAAYAQADDADPRVRRKERRAVPADEHGQGPAARHASAMRRRCALDRAEGRPTSCMLIGARLNWLLSHGKGKAWGEAPKKFIQIDIEPKEMDSNVEIVAPVVGDIGSCVTALLDGMGAQVAGGRRPTGSKTVTTKRDENVAKMAPRLMNNNVADGLSRRARRAAHHRQGAAGRDPGQRRRQHARSRARHHRHVSAAQAHRRRHLGHHGHRHGLRHRRRHRDRQAGAVRRRRLGVRLLRHGGRDHLPLQAAGLHRHLQQ